MPSARAMVTNACTTPVYSGGALPVLHCMRTFSRSVGENVAAAAFVFQWQDNGTKFVQVLPQGSGSDPILATKPAWDTIPTTG